MLFLTLCPFLSLLLISQSFLEGLSEDRNLGTDPAYGHSPCPSSIKTTKLVSRCSYRRDEAAIEGRAVCLLVSEDSAQYLTARQTLCGWLALQKRPKNSRSARGLKNQEKTEWARP